MNLSLTLVGAGEYTSFVEGASRSYFRFRAADGRLLDLDVSEDQIRTVISFAVAGDQEAAQPAHIDKSDAFIALETPSLRGPVTLDEGDPNIVDEEEESRVVHLRGPQIARAPQGSPSPFASRDDDL